MLTRSIMVRFVGATLIVAGLVVAAGAQSAKDSLVIYAKAGRINHAIGSAHVRRGADEAGKILTVSDELAAGDIVEAGADTQLEVLLSPGSFLRLAANSEFEMHSTALDDIRVILRRGSAVVETGGGPDETLRIQVATPTGTAIIEKKGIYRFNVSPTSSQFFAVNGQFTVVPQNVKVKSGNQLTIDGSTFGATGTVAKFDKKASQDALDIWSRDRAQLLAKANQQLNGNDMTLAMNRFGAGDGFYAALRGQVGFWAFSPFRGFCMFVPFDPWNWQSPYGYSYSNGNYWNWNYLTARQRLALGIDNTGTINGNNGGGNGSPINGPVKMPDPVQPIQTALPSGGPRGGNTPPPTTGTKDP
jgi:hypothetical protein